MQAIEDHVFEFGDFQLAAAERRLLKDGQPVPLPPRVFDTLLLLVQNHGRLIDKQELMTRLWPNSFVEEVNLNRSISSLRKALGESASSPVFIETVPKSGYRFVAPVVEVKGEGNLILEKYTSKKITTEEEEEIFDSFGPEARTTMTGTRVVSTLRRRSVAVAGSVVVIAIAALTYVWTTGKPDRGATATTVKSIAVLPFKDLGAQGESDHLGLGMADVLITRLGNLKQINVRPTSAVSRYDREQDLIEAGRTLGVDALVEGSIQRSGEQIRVTARLVRASDQTTIWSGQFDESAKNIFAVQDAISRQVADSLALNLTAGERARLAKHYTENADAYQLYAKGRYHWNKRNNEGMERAQYYFRRATEEDPNFALAYLGLADVVLTSWDSPGALSAIEKAIELDGALGEAQATQGFAMMFHRWKWGEAEESFKRAINLSPGYGTAHQWYATLLAITGRVQEAKREMIQALEIDPMSHNFLADLGQLNYFAKEYGPAEAYCRKALEVYPRFTFAHQYLFEICFATGRPDEAFEEYLKWYLSLGSDSIGTREQVAYEARLRSIYLQSGMRGVLRNKIDEHMRGAQGALSYQIARAHAMLGERQETLEWLEKACDNKNLMLAFVNADPVFDSLHTDPRFQGVLRRMGLAS